MRWALEEAEDPNAQQHTYHPSCIHVCMPMHRVHESHHAKRDSIKILQCNIPLPCFLNALCTILDAAYQVLKAKRQTTVEHSNLMGWNVVFDERTSGYREMGVIITPSQRSGVMSFLRPTNDTQKSTQHY